MKILAIVGSPRKKGNTDVLVEAAIVGAKNQGAEVEKIYLSDLKFDGCIGCEGCKKSCKCVIKDDMQQLYSKLENADGIILGSPTYFYNVTWLTKKFLDRLYAYEIFDSSDRSVWSSVFEKNRIKYAVTIAVCEQNDIKDMGFASDAMNMALSAVGIRNVYSVKALHLFNKNSVIPKSEIAQETENAGEKLVKTIKLGY